MIDVKNNVAVIRNTITKRREKHHIVDVRLFERGNQIPDVDLKRMARASEQLPPENDVGVGCAPAIHADTSTSWPNTKEYG